MENLKIEIIYSDFFIKNPIIKKCYEYYKKYYSFNEDIPKPFIKYKNKDKDVYPLGIYINTNVKKLIYLNSYGIEEADLNYTIKWFKLENPIKLLDTTNLSDCYYRFLLLSKMVEFFKNEN